MTPVDLDALNRRIFTAHPELAAGWKPADNSLSKREFIGTRNEVRWAYPDEIPPPNIMDWDTFGRVLVEMWDFGAVHLGRTKHDPNAAHSWRAMIWPTGGHAVTANANTPQLALALAIDAMEQK